MTFLAEGFGAAQTELQMLKMKIKGAENAAEGSKRAWAGILVSNLGAQLISTEDIHVQLAMAEASRAAKKRRGRGKQHRLTGKTLMKTPLSSRVKQIRTECMRAMKVIDEVEV